VPGHWQTQSIAIDASDDSSVISGITGKVCQVGIIASATDNRGALANSGILGKIVGYDASVVVTNPANPVSRLSLSQLAGVFSGAITNWSQVGGPNAPIAVFAPDQPGHYLAAFRRTVLNGSSLAASARVVNDPPAVSAAVVRDRDAIGFSGFIYADPGHVLQIGGADGFQPPTNSTIGQRHYPLTIPIYMYNTAQQTEPMVFDFIDFVRSDAGQTIVEDAGYVSRLSL
jgi:phosphate transport system substrate-binding protein